MYFLPFTLFPARILVVFCRKIVNWLFSVLVLWEIVASLHWHFKIRLLPSWANPGRNEVPSTLMKPVMFWVLSTLLNKASSERYPAKVDEFLNRKCHGFIQKLLVNQKKSEKINLFLKLLKKKS